MKNHRQPSKSLLRSLKPGFALVVTISLMVLLTIVAVGMLSLASITLRTSTHEESMATARANARLALMLAIGELQKNAGPDQRITARSDILDETIANPMLTGVWNSWEMKATPPPQPSEFERPARDAKFLGWLVSGTDPLTTHQVSYASQPLPSPVTLWGKGSLGDKAPSTRMVSATKVPLSSSPGALAWAVMDEGVKTRINTRFADDAATDGAKTVELGAGERPGTEFIPGLDTLERKFFEKSAPQAASLDKGITRLNFALAGESLAPGIRDALKPLTHDVTFRSLGLFTDVAHGGLKQDFQLLMNSPDLPTAYNAKGVYASSLELNPATVPSDPRWESFQQFSRLYRDKITSSRGVPVIKAQVPVDWAAATRPNNTVPPKLNIAPPPGVVLMPTIAKVQVLFSLVANDIFVYSSKAGDPIDPAAPQLHGPQGNYFRGTKYQYELDLMYTPIVTLHNPYNVAIECTDLGVEFVNVPFAATVYRNGVAQCTDLAPIDQMFYQSNEQGLVNKRFAMKLKTNSNGYPGSSTIQLLPGEVVTFSPYLDPNHTWWDEQHGNRIYWDFDSKDQNTNITQNIVAIPGWRGDGIGFVLDWWNPAPMRIGGPDKEFGRWAGCIGLARDDRIHIKFAPRSVPNLSKNKFIVQLTMNSGASAGSTICNAIEFDYESPNGLQDFVLGSGKTLRYPKTGTIGTYDMLIYQRTPIKDARNVKPFCLLSAQAKTTSGGRDQDKEDGSLATKPWCFAHANIGASTQKVVSEHSANHSHEIDMQVLDVAKGSSNLVQVDQMGRGNFISGHTAFNGTKFGGQYDIPLAPIQTLASLNGANPGGSSGYLPRVAQPIGNSWAPPQISSNNIVETKSAGNYLDHSFLLNLALYDRFYFSGFADQSGSFGTGKTAAMLATSFAVGTPLADPRVVLYQPDGRPASALADEISKPTAYTNVAGWQLMQGAFNINSTSVPAWMAMLASIHDSQALYNQLVKPGPTPTSRLTPLPATASRSARVSRFRLPAAIAGTATTDAKDSYWLGAREYSDQELQKLAGNIVKQVRLRGPFLSMAEFVNRRLAAGNPDTALRGALQQAIDDSDLNQTNATAANAGFEIPVESVAEYKYLNPAAGAGSSYQGAPGYLCQADILNVLGNAATARSDTFTIRGYGEARDPSGRILSKATCEAVVQRYPDWLDTADKVETVPASLTRQSNKTFGRRFLVTSFRWLDPDEI